MTKREARERLLKMISSHLGVTARPNEPIAVTLESIADFCDVLRAGCQQDLVRLIKKLIFTDSGELEKINGVEALANFGITMNEGSEIELWGLDDCKCDRGDCVYCGPRIATRAMSTSRVSGRNPVESISSDAS